MHVIGLISKIRVVNTEGYLLIVVKIYGNPILRKKGKR